jgi:catechol 1,2-dioxygenase
MSDMKSSEKLPGRRKFIRNSSLFAVAISIPGLVSCKEDGSEEPGTNNCSTTDDILGPFYKPGAPFREDITPSGATGAPLIVQGQVFSACDTILKDALVEIWNANDNGEYDTTQEFNFRGSYQTGADGNYRFRTIIPGRYLNGGTFRPSHIHFRITASGHGELVSQIYFRDDPFIQDDPWAGSSKASKRILTIGQDTNGADTVNFNIYLIPKGK